MEAGSQSIKVKAKGKMLRRVEEGRGLCESSGKQQMFGAQVQGWSRK